MINKSEIEAKEKDDKEKRLAEKAKILKNNEDKLKVENVIKQSFVADLKVGSQTDSIVMVIGSDGSKATVALHKRVNGIWTQVLSVGGYVGYNGITYSKTEGNGKTPAGVYSFGTGFGIESNPGTSLSYRRITNDDYWVDDSNSNYYNKWANTNEVIKDWNSAEHLISYTYQYRYGAVINYNTSSVAGKGSGIFLHCATGNTEGCIGVPQAAMITILGNINSNSKIVIAQNNNDIYNY